MRAISKILTALLVIALLAAVSSPAYAKSDKSSSSGQLSFQQLSELFNLKKPLKNFFQDFNKLTNELAKTERTVVKFFERRGAQAVGTALVEKTLTPNLDGTWHITISLTRLPGQTVNVYDELKNLLPIPGSFNVEPSVVDDGLVVWFNLPADVTTLEFNAVQIFPGFVADQVFVNSFVGFSGLGGFIANDSDVGFRIIVPTEV